LINNIVNDGFNPFIYVLIHGKKCVCVVNTGSFFLEWNQPSKKYHTQNKYIYIYIYIYIIYNI
jgi:hypothetical protein